MSTGLSSLVAGATDWGLLLVAVQADHAGRLGTVGVAVVVLTGLAAFEATSPLADAARQLGAVRASARRLTEVFDLPSPVREPFSPVPLPANPVHLRVRGARLRYSSDGPWALDGVDLDLPARTRVAVVGETGSGKSSLVNVLLRCRDLDDGTATLNGHLLDTFAGDAVRVVIGGMPADGHIFDSTVRENLRLADPQAGQAELDAVADRVRLRDWIESLPQGWDTPLGAHGQAMSGGGPQRLLLARALLADPEVLVLDEPTAHLDPGTRDVLMQDLLTATQGRTVLLITHDATGLEQMDRVVTLAHGRVLIQRSPRDPIAG